MTETRPITRDLTIKAPIDRVWLALADARGIEDWMDDDSVVIEAHTGGRCRFFGGSTTGRVLRVEKPRLIEYSWRQEEWPAKWRDSTVTWELTAIDRQHTRLRLVHKSFPNKKERDSHDKGWTDYWIGPMIEHLEG